MTGIYITGQKQGPRHEKAGQNAKPDKILTREKEKTITRQDNHSDNTRPDKARQDNCKTRPNQTQQEETGQRRPP